MNRTTRAATKTTGTSSPEASVASRNGTLRSGSSGAWGARRSRAERASVARRRAPRQAPPGGALARLRVARDRAQPGGVLACRLRVAAQLVGQRAHLAEHEGEREEDGRRDGQQDAEDCEARPVLSVSRGPADGGRRARSRRPPRARRARACAHRGRPRRPGARSGRGPLLDRASSTTSPAAAGSDDCLTEPALDVQLRVHRRDDELLSDLRDAGSERAAGRAGHAAGRRSRSRAAQGRLGRSPRARRRRGARSGSGCRTPPGAARPRPRAGNRAPRARAARGRLRTRRAGAPSGRATRRSARPRDVEVSARHRPVEAIRELLVARGGGVADEPGPRFRHALGRTIREPPCGGRHLCGLDVRRRRERRAHGGVGRLGKAKAPQRVGPQTAHPADERPAARKRTSAAMRGLDRSQDGRDSGRVLERDGEAAAVLAPDPCRPPVAARGTERARRVVHVRRKSRERGVARPDALGEQTPRSSSPSPVSAETTTSGAPRRRLRPGGARHRRARRRRHRERGDRPGSGRSPSPPRARRVDAGSGRGRRVGVLLRLDDPGDQVREPDDAVDLEGGGQSRPSRSREGRAVRGRRGRLPPPACDGAGSRASRVGDRRRPPRRLPAPRRSSGGGGRRPPAPLRRAR